MPEVIDYSPVTVNPYSPVTWSGGAAVDPYIQQELNLAAGQGGLESALIDRRYQQRMGAAKQFAAGRGLFNTTALNTMQNEAGLDESLAQEGVQENVNRNELGVLERGQEMAMRRAQMANQQAWQQGRLGIQQQGVGIAQQRANTGDVRAATAQQVADDRANLNSANISIRNRAQAALRAFQEGRITVDQYNADVRNRAQTEAGRHNQATESTGQQNADTNQQRADTGQQVADDRMILGSQSNDIRQQAVNNQQAYQQGLITIDQYNASVRALTQLEQSRHNKVTEGQGQEKIDGATTPADTQPAATQPAATQPAATQPAATQPAATQPTSMGASLPGSDAQALASHYYQQAWENLGPNAHPDDIAAHAQDMWQSAQQFQGA